MERGKNQILTHKFYSHDGEKVCEVSRFRNNIRNVGGECHSTMERNQLHNDEDEPTFANHILPHDDINHGC